MQRAELFRAELLIAVDDFDGAEQVATDGLAIAETRRQSSAVKSWQRFLGRYFLQAGRVADTVAMLDGVLTVSSATSAVNVDDASTMVAHGRAAIHMGDGNHARTWATSAESALASDVPELRRHAAWLLALHAMAAGDATNARVRLAELGEDGDVSVLPTLAADITEYAQLVRIARDAGDDELAQSAVDAAEARCRRNPGVRSIAATAAHARGLFEGDASALADAAELFAGGPRRLAHASALEDCGVELVREGDRRGRRRCARPRPAALLDRRRSVGRVPSATAAARTGCATAPRQGGPSDDGMGGLDRRRSRRGTPRCRGLDES